MKKEIVIIMIGCLLFSSVPMITAVITNMQENHTITHKEKITITFPPNDKIILKENSIKLDGLTMKALPGNPILPWKTFRYVLPKNTIEYTIEFNAKFHQISNNQTITPSAPIYSYNVDEKRTNQQLYNQWETNMYNIYTTNSYYPESIGTITTKGFFHENEFLTISLCPFRYNPVTKTLSYSDTINVVISYQQPIHSNRINTVSFNNIDKYNQNLFYNHEILLSNSYKDENSLETYDFLIITTDELVESIVNSGFIDWKTSLGFHINIVTLSDERIQNQPGIDLSAKIRSFLRQYYQEWGVEFVLFIGDYQTVPMRYCYPNPENHQYDPFDMFSGEVPTDYYYADLSLSDEKSWDSDGDGFYGEYAEDSPDFLAEIYVGRIPVNDPEKISYTLNKIVDFEQDTGAWKQNALQAGAFFYFTNEDRIYNIMDGAVLSFQIEQDIMDDWFVSKYSEQDGLEQSVYQWPALSEESFITDWRTGEYGVVNWQGHGWTTGVARKVWDYDDGDEVPEANEISWPFFITGQSDLDDDYPSVVTAVSCYVGCPEPDNYGNLGVDLLTDPDLGAGVAVVASARSPYGSIDWPKNLGGSDSIIYEFNKNMIKQSKNLGDSLYTAKFFCNQEYGWDSYFEYIDMFTFNLYGDPSMLLRGAGENTPPITPIVQGPSNGNISKEYTYEAVSSDQDKDQIFYQFDWGDGTMSNWVGPYESDVGCSLPHSWNKKDTYEIRVKAKDESGATSEWGVLSISMEKHTNILFEKFYDIVLYFLKKMRGDDQFFLLN